MKKPSIPITRFEYNDFWIDIIDMGTYFEAWLSHKQYGISSMMFGALKKDVTFTEFVDLVQCNLENENYVDTYIEEFCDLDV